MHTVVRRMCSPFIWIRMYSCMSCACLALDLCYLVFRAIRWRGYAQIKWADGDLASFYINLTSKLTYQVQNHISKWILFQSKSTRSIVTVFQTILFSPNTIQVRVNLRQYYFKLHITATYPTLPGEITDSNLDFKPFFVATTALPTSDTPIKMYTLPVRISLVSFVHISRNYSIQFVCLCAFEFGKKSIR